MNNQNGGYWMPPLPWQQKPELPNGRLGPWGHGMKPPAKDSGAYELIPEVKPLITAEQLKAMSPGTPMARINEFIPHLNKYCRKYHIDTPIEIVSFLCQILHETGGLKWLKEIWGPTAQQLRYERDFTQPWNTKSYRNSLAYALGNVNKGDGKKYAGKGAIHVTGAKNTELVSMKMFGDKRLLEDPSILTKPEYAIWSACIWWYDNDMDAIDDDFYIKRDTKKVNGGYNGLDDRQKYFDRGLKVFGIK